MATAVVTPPADTLEQKFAKIESNAASAAAIPGTPSPSVETPATPPAAVPGQETPAEKPIEGVEPEEAEVDLEAAPESSGDFSKYKPLFQENPELRQILGREKAFSEMQGEQPFSEFKEIHERVPTLADAERLVEESSNAREFGRTYRENPVQFVESLRQSDPNAFGKLISDLPNILAKTDVNSWRAQATSYLDPVLANLHGIAVRENNEALQQAVQLVAQSLGIAPGSRTAAVGNSEVEELRKKLAEKENSEGQQAFQNFWSQTDAKVMDQSVSEIESTLKKIVPSATEPHMKRMVGEVYTNLLAALGAQPQFVAQVDTYRQNAKKGRMGISDHNAIVDFSFKRAKLAIPRIARDVAAEWNESILQTNNKKIEQKSAIAAKTKDVGSGPQATTSAAAAVPKSGKMTSEDIFKAMESGTYVPPKSRV